MGRVSREARLLFIMLWLACDDEGKTRGHSRKLAGTLYPYDEDAPKLIDRWLGELERENVIFRYQVDGTTYLKVVTWGKHQKIDKPSKSRLPDPSEADSKQPIREHSRTLSNPPEGHAKAVETLAEVSRDVEEHSRLYLGPRTRDLGPSDNQQTLVVVDTQLVCEDRKPAATVRPLKAISSKVVRGTRWPSGQRVPTEWIADVPALLAARNLPMIDAELEADKFKNYWSAKAGSGATKVDWRATWENWVWKAGDDMLKGNFNGRGSRQFGASRNGSSNSLGAFAQVGCELDEVPGTNGRPDYGQAAH